MLVAACALSAAARAEDSGAPSAPLLQSAARSLNEFATTKAPLPLQIALLDLSAAKRALVRGAERDRLTNAWFTLFRTLDSVKSPSFDPSDLPQLHVVPPPDHGVIYPAGVNPSALSDPAARAAYERAIRANRAKAIRFAASYPLADLDTAAKAAFRLYRGRAYTSSAADAADFARLLGKSRLSPVRKKVLAA